MFVGAINRLYQLSHDLDVVAEAKTGPQNDSTECTIADCPSSTARKLTDNVNKVLLIDYTTSRLITCGSLFQGLCYVRNLQNVSIVEMEVQEAVVANDEQASTVAFIGPGPPSFPTTNVMYVGVTFTGNSPYRSEVPAVSSRSLDRERMFQIASSAVTTGTRMFINSISREQYLIHYVYGFSSEKFSYFLTNQLKHDTHSQPREYISKLVRICQEDSNYYSYTEIPIKCGTADNGRTLYNIVRAAYLGKPGSELAESMGITVQDDILYAVFSEGTHPDDKEGPSALCVYSLKSIRRRFMQNIRNCFNGSGQRGLGFISPSMRCIQTKLQTIGEDFCGLDVNSPLGGELSMEASPALKLHNSTLATAIAATSTSAYSVVFIGTQQGHLKKVVVDSATHATEYADIAVDEGSPINKDMFFDKKEMYLYVMGAHSVSKIKVHDCSIYNTCTKCLGARDPYCGWCYMEHKCTLRSNCEDDSNDPLFWVPYKSGKCTNIVSVTPHQIQRTTARTLELVIDHLPNIKEHLACVFTIGSGPPVITDGTKKRNGLNCTTPRTDLVPAMESGQHHITSVLSVRTASGPDIVSTNFTFFDCGSYMSCTSCVSSMFPCDWCVEAHR